MKICILAATQMELQFLSAYQFPLEHSVSFVVHGVGILAATYHIEKAANTKPDFMIQCGIAGSFNTQLQISETVIVRDECLGDTGVEDHEDIIDVFNLGISDADEFPFQKGILTNPHISSSLGCRQVKGITVNMGSGNENTIRRRKEMYNADIETMEGACLHYVCLQHEIPFLQFRGISNFIEPRNKSNWNINDSIVNCHQKIIQFIGQTNLK